MVHQLPLLWVLNIFVLKLSLAFAHISYDNLVNFRNYKSCVDFSTINIKGFKDFQFFWLSYVQIKDFSIQFKQSMTQKWLVDP